MVGRRWWTPWIWLAPMLAVLAVFLVYPAVDTARRSLLDARSRDFVGLDNYRTLIENPSPLVADTHAALLNNVFWIVAFPTVTVALGLVLAVLTGRVRYEAIAKSGIFVPMAISFVAASVIWRFMFDFNDQIGTANAALTAAGGDARAWLQDTDAPQQWLTAVGPDELPGPFQINNLALVSVGIWMWTGFAMVVLSAGLKGVSREVIEAARVDGASELQIFRRIIVPMMSPTIAVVVWVMTGGRFQTDVIATLFFKEAFVVRDFGVGAALAVVLLLWIVPVMVVSIRRFQFQEEVR
jgi:alpha-glucoside transport system permease protein